MANEEFGGQPEKNIEGNSHVTLESAPSTGFMTRRHRHPKERP